MVVGDVVGAFSSALNTILVFQPALGVSVLVTSTYDHNNGAKVSIRNSTTVATDESLSVSPAAGSSNTGNLKIMIDNTVYLNIGAFTPGGNGAFSGIQIA
jgi:hypothetical protein|tara:strand:- start:293 stop:592 length:300 start_codon:yes stop_codon:yes gene_type:complete